MQGFTGSGAQRVASFWGAGVALLMGLALVVSGCGGGGSAPPGAPAETASSFTVGSVSGFGSIIVDGVRFDDSGASVSDDSDDSLHSSADLKLGMMVEIDGSAIDRAAGRARALRIRFGAEIVGPVESVDTAGLSMVVLGQTVDIKDFTVFDDSLAGGLGGISKGEILAVNARLNDTNGHYVATRIDDRPGAANFRLRGVIGNLDANAKTFTVGTATINYASVDPTRLPANLANGMRVRMRLQTAPVGGQWIATEMRAGDRRVEDRAEAEVHGMITRFESLQHFAINGLEVNAANASFPDGTAGIALNANVEVEGAIVAGVLVARKVEIEDHSNDIQRFELHGAVESLNTTENTFLLRGVKVNYSQVLFWEGGTEANLANGKPVEVKGLLSPDRTRLLAVKIKFES